MYDFILGDKATILKNAEEEKRFLLSVKRMLPRWCNSIPDSEFLSLYDVLSDTSGGGIYVETGSGASTIVLFWFAMKNGGKLYTWDTNGSKLYFLRTVIFDAIIRVFKEKSIWKIWYPVATASTSEYAGISALSDIPDIAEKGVSACFLDSEHTIDNLLAETKQVLKLMRKGSVIIIDDSNYRSLHVNMAYANMLRRKLGLLPCEEPKDNISEKTFGESVETYLSENVAEVVHIDDTYKTYYKDDLFWAYYKTDRDIMADMDMEKYDNLEHRFDAWKIIKK